MVVSFIGWGKQEYPENTTDLSQVTDKLYHILLYRVHLAWVGFELTILVAICTDCTGSCKSNYHTITPGPSSDYERTLWLFQKRVVRNKLKICVLLLGAPPPLKLEKIWFFWRKIVIFHMKYPKNFACPPLKLEKYDFLA